MIHTDEPAERATTTRGAVATADRRIGGGRPGGPGIGWTELLSAVPLYLVLSAGLGFAAFLAYGRGPTGMPPTTLILALTGAATLVTAFAVLALRVRTLAALGLRRTTVRWILIAVAAGLVTRVLAFGVGWGYQQLTGDMSNPQAFLGESLTEGSTVVLAGVLLTGAVLVPFAEELLFRGVGYGALSRYGAWVAVPGSAAIFAVAHGLNVVLVIAFVLGVVCALLYRGSRSIWPAVVTHAVFNASGFLLATLFL